MHVHVAAQVEDDLLLVDLDVDRVEGAPRVAHLVLGFVVGGAGGVRATAKQAVAHHANRVVVVTAARGEEEAELAGDVAQLVREDQLRVPRLKAVRG